MNSELLDRLESRIDALLQQLEGLRSENRRLNTELVPLRLDRQELDSLRELHREQAERLSRLEQQLAEAPDPALLEQIRSRVQALVGRLEQASEPADSLFPEHGPSA
jgi:chromosome segregation ATPase